MSSTYSYTAVSGKRPGLTHRDGYRWFSVEDLDQYKGELERCAFDLPRVVFDRLEGGCLSLYFYRDYPTHSEALAAADAAARQAIADGVWTPEGGK